MNGSGSRAAEADAMGAAAFESSMESFAVPGASGMTDHESGDDAAHSAGLLPLALPGSPTLLPLGASASPTSAALALATSKPSSHVTASTHSYFDTNGGASANGGFHTGGDFAELSKASEEYRRLADAAASASLELAAMPTGSNPLIGSGPVQAKKRAAKKRKGGSNVSIDLQTKIRLIELAEEYQYDPKGSTRGKQGEGGSNAGSSIDAVAHVSAHGRDQMSGIRLAAQFGLNKSTVSRILKRKEEFKKAYYKDNISGMSKHINKKSKFDKLNRLVENWFDMNRDKKIAVTDTLIRDVGKRFAEELGIADFRGSNGWVRSLRNRKEHQSRHLSVEAMELEKIKKDAEAIERMRAVFPNGMKDLSGFFRDLSVFLEKGVGFDSAGGADSHTDVATAAAMAGGVLPASAYGELGAATDGRDEERVADEFMRKKMADSLRSWSHELLEAELAQMKTRLKPRPQSLTGQDHDHDQDQDSSEQAATL